MKQSIRMLVAALALCAPCAFAAQETDLSRGDPARWEQPNRTPQQKYASAMYEARQALREALAECRAARERKSCEAEARANYQNDVEQAKTLLAKPVAG
jgi:hypothetical protein